MIKSEVKIIAFSAWPLRFECENFDSSGCVAFDINSAHVHPLVVTTHYLLVCAVGQVIDVVWRFMDQAAGDRATLAAALCQLNDFAFDLASPVDSGSLFAAAKLERNKVTCFS